MKIAKKMVAVMMLALAFAGCHRESTNFGPDGGRGESDGKTGYITFAASGIVVEWSGENVNTPAGSEDFPDLEAYASHTRAGAAVDVDDFEVSLLKFVDGVSEVVAVKSLAEWRAAGAYGVPFTQGGRDCSYRIVASSGAEMKDTAWDGDEGQPTYRGETPLFKVGTQYSSADNAMPVPDVRCTLESIKVSVSLEKSMAELSSNVTLTALIFDPAKDVGTSPYSLEFEDGAQKPHRFGVVYLDPDTQKVQTEMGNNGFDVVPAYGYFKPVAAQNAITLHVEMLYGGNTASGGVRINQDVAICTGAKANEYRRIMLYVTHGEADDLGKIFINAAVETWTYDEEVTVDVVSDLLWQNMVGENAIPDIDSADDPRITSPDFTFDDTNRFDASSYTASGDYIPSAKIDVVTVSPISRFEVTLSTDNAMLRNYYSMFGVNGTTVDLTGSDAPSAQARLYLSSLGFPRSEDIDGQTSLRLDVRKFLSHLYLYGGHHRVVLTVADNGPADDGVNPDVSTVTLDLYYDSENGSAGEIDRTPSIVWPGKDMNNRYDVGPDGLKVDINISAPLGIEHLYVKMSGKIEAGLTGMMPTEFDLTDPEKAQEGLSATLEELKFPVGDDVKGQTELLFDISGFMTMLSVFPGESDFELTVVDAEGQQTTSTIKLNVLEN